MSSWFSSDGAIKLEPHSTDFPKPPAIAELKTKFAGKVQQMRELLKEDLAHPDNKIYDDDVWLIRFLFNPKYTIEQCAERYRVMIQKRKADGVDKILKDLQTQGHVDNSKFPHFEQVSHSFPETLSRTKDCYGQPVALQQLGKSDPAYFVQHLSKEQFYQYTLYKAEFMRITLDKMCVETGLLLQWVQVIDLAGLGVRHCNTSAMDLFKHASKQVDQMYKECLGKVLIVNVPRPFYMMWNLMKVWIAERTVQKVTLLTTQPELLGAIVEKHDWPLYLGGHQKTGTIARIHFNEKGAV
jgi:hypothetical protein